LSGHGFEAAGRGVNPGHEILDVGLRVAVDDLGDDVREIVLGIDLVEFAGLDQ